MTSNIQILQDNITPNTLAIFWITEKSLSKDTPLAEEFDYFTNGQISNFLKESKNLNVFHYKNIFFQKNFDEDNFICHIKDDQALRKETLSQLQSLINAVKTERTEILLINFSAHNYSDDIEKLYANKEIRELTFVAPQ